MILRSDRPMARAGGFPGVRVIRDNWACYRGYLFICTNCEGTRLLFYLVETGQYPSLLDWLGEREESR